VQSVSTNFYRNRVNKGPISISRLALFVCGYHYLFTLLCIRSDLKVLIYELKKWKCRILSFDLNLGQTFDYIQTLIHMKRITSILVTAFLIAATLTACGERKSNLKKETIDELQSGFQNPPKESRVRVWWHWMGNDVTESGIRADFEWFKRVGIAGFHQFNLGGSQGDAVYMSDVWKDRLYFAARLADSLDLEMGVPSCAGFSATAGPWVTSEEGMKKLVWRTMEVRGGNVDVQLPASFTKVGAFQNGAPAGRSFDANAREAGGEIAVLAVKLPEGTASPLDAAITSSGGDFSLEMLTDNDVMNGSILPPGKDGFAWIQYEFPQAVTVRSISIVGLAGGGFPGMGGGRPSANSLECSQDGKEWTRVCDVRGGSAAQATMSVPETTARYFRLTVQNPQPRPMGGMNAFGMGAGSLGAAPAPAGTRISEFIVWPSSRIDRAEDKAGFTAANNLMASATKTSVSEAFPSLNDVIDISDKVDASGRLRWEAPEGRWRIYRFAWSITGEVNHPASDEAMGLEVDKMDPIAFSRFIHVYLDTYRDATKGFLGEKGIRYLLTDSFEADNENWTPAMLESFERLRGYDMKSWMPVLAGEIIGSADESERFLHDWRATISDLIAGSYDLLTEIIRNDYGMEGGYYESHEGGRAYVVDGMDVKRTASVPMGAMWVESPWLRKGPDGRVNRVNQEADLRESASVAHIYGQNYVAAESMTTWGDQLQYQYAPEDLKETADQELANGVNRFYVHLSAHQARETVPGIGMGGVIGQWFNRHETWAEMAGAWVDYISRTSYLLSVGLNVADVLYYYGEDSNVTAQFGGGSGVPAGYQWDYCNPTALKDEIVATKDGNLMAKAGKTEYRLLWMDRNVDYMSTDVLRKIAALVKSGVQLGGVRPTHAASLADDPAEFDELVKDIWDSGRANVHESTDMLAVLKEIGVSPDVNIDKDYRYLHRDCGKVQVYWINKPLSEGGDATLSFRVSGLKPSVWHAETGKIEEASYRVVGDRTEVDLHLVPNDAVFVVFSGKGESSHSVDVPVDKVVLSVTSPWTVKFQENRGAPASATFTELKSLSESDVFGIRYFSGVATYCNTLSADKVEGRAMLDLGSVKNIAEVYVNGKFCGTAWKAPWTVDVTDALKEGENTLEIKVANLWVNRLVGDNQPDAPERICTTPGVQSIYPADYPLKESGLLGPVRLIERK